MKFMETINEIQKLFTKLRREVQRSEAGTKEEYACRKCGRRSRVVKLDRLCPFCDFDPPKPAFTTGECICYPLIPGSHKNCPVHGTAGECDRYYKLPDGRTQCRECGWIVSNGCNCIDRADPGRKQKRHIPKVGECTCGVINVPFGLSQLVDDIPMRPVDPSCPIHGAPTKTKKRSCVGGCGRPACHSSNFCEYYFTGTGWGCDPPVKTVGECTCLKTGEQPLECPVHQRDRFGLGIVAPDLPLHVRVAKALGWKDIRFEAHAWIGRPPTWRPDVASPVEEYDKCIDRAMGALEEYCEENDCFLNIYGGSERKWEIQVFDKDTHVAKVSKLSTSFADAICLAIVAHAEEE